MKRVVHFEFPTTDPAASQKFFETVLGWSFQKWDGPEDYRLAMTGEKDSPGINGALYVPGEHMNGTVNTVDVENLDATLELVLASGGQVVEQKMEIPGVGWVAYVRDPGGIFFGIIEAMPGAMM